MLSGRLDLPLKRTPRAYVLFAHCFTCSKNLRSVDHISQSMTAEGFAVLRFDFTGLGQSKGEFADSNFSTNLDDLTSACTFLGENYASPQVLIGHSLGGTAVLHVAGMLPDVKAVVTLAAPADPGHVMHLLSSSVDTLEKDGEAEVDIGGRPFKMKKQFLDDLKAREEKEDVIAHLGRALLVMHSPQDTIVGIDNAADIYARARHPKSFISLDGADHLLFNEKDAWYTGKMAAAWCARYIDEAEQEVAPEGEVLTRVGGAGYTTEVIAGRHHLLGDEPADVGGADLGPSPYGYLLAALGTCTAMTLRMYADYKKIDLHEVEVRLTHDKVHKDDGENSESAKGKIDQIKRLIKLTGDLTDAQRKRLIQIADRCPVHKTLEGKPEILTDEMN